MKYKYRLISTNKTFQLYQCICQKHCIFMNIICLELQYVIFVKIKNISEDDATLMRPKKR